jgi:Zn2+/Cd2+-exporting ATPase
MDCAEEVATLKSQLLPLPGVLDLSFNVLEGQMAVTYSAEQVTPDELITAVGRTGMRAVPLEESRVESQEGSAWDRWGRTVMTALSGMLLTAGFSTHVLLVGWRGAFGGADAIGVPMSVKGIYLAAAVAGAWFVAPKAWLALRRRRPDMNLLMTVAVLGAVLIGEWLEAATVTFLFAVALALESWSVSRARRAIAALMEMAPSQARVIGSDGNEELVDVEQVPVGARIVIKPGDRIPLDGHITAGQTTVNQAPVTGESLPVTKAVGDEVFAGTINQDGAIEVSTVKPAAQNTIAQIIKMVREAQSKRSPSEQWVEQFARYYTPAVMTLAITVAIIPPLFMSSWADWFYQALVLLVIACPCALVISTPVSIVAALAAAARHGVLIKGGEYVELPSRLAAIALDKTGTLTEGRPQVVRVVPLSGHTESDLLGIAAAIERRSEHPLGQAIVAYASQQGIRPAPVDGFQAVKGKGATAVLDGRSVWVGSHRYLEERRHESVEVHDLLQELSSGGSSVVAIGEEGHVCGFIALADRLRPHARDAVHEMRAAGIGHVVMLTGDNRPTAEAIARESGVDEVWSELLPQDKVAAVEDLLARYGTVGMVGDGVNDAPALARADLGIVMGAIGTDAAMETADIALMSDDLSRLPWLVRYSRRVLRVIRQNIFASLAIKVIFVLLTFAGWASLWAAIAADMGTSLLVVSNALRLLRD